MANLDQQMSELVDLAIAKSKDGQPLVKTITVPRELLLRLYAAWACARLKEQGDKTA